jgi:hypothetical protein
VKVFLFRSLEVVLDHLQTLYTTLRQFLRIWAGCDFAKSILFVTLPALGKGSSFETLRFDLALSRRAHNSQNLPARGIAAPIRVYLRAMTDDEFSVNLRFGLLL